MEDTSDSWFSLAKNQDSSSGALFVRQRVEENDLLLSVFMPVLASLPGESQWVGPQPTTVIKGSKGHLSISVFWQLL